MEKSQNICSINELLAVIKKHQETYEGYEQKNFTNKNSRALTGPPWFKYNSNLWFRGQADNTWELKPKVERPDFCDVAESSGTDPIDYERSLFNQFLVQGAHLIPTNLTQTEKYFLAQHYGLPTRLLDWSTNPLTALYFAVTDNLNKNGALYIFYARSTFSGHEADDVLYQNNQKFVSEVEKHINEDYIWASYNGHYPQRIIPKSQNGRILQQDSRFTYHLPSGIPLKKQIDKSIYNYTISNTCKKEILADLQMLGTHGGSLFPDLEHLVKELKRQAHL